MKHGGFSHGNTRTKAWKKAVVERETTTVTTRKTDFSGVTTGSLLPYRAKFT